MKVVHLSSSDDGGAGIAAYRIHTAMLTHGIDSSMLVLYRKNNNPTVKLIETLSTPPLLNKVGMSPHFYVSSMRWHCLIAQHPQRPKGLEMFSDASSDVNLEEIREIRDADIINLHWVAGMVDYCRLSTILRGKKVVWTLHDMNPFTGGCHYTGSCLKYQKACFACPQLGSNPDFDYANYIFRQKHHGIGELNVTIAAPSRWLAECARNSAIFGGKTVHCLPNGISVDTFRPYPREPVRNLFGIPSANSVILFGAFGVGNERKGFRLLIEALQKLPATTLNCVTLAFFGKSPKELSAQLPCQIVGIGHISEEENLAQIYSMADLFVIPSLEDNLPNTVLESLACGTPVAGFRIGGIPDMITHMKTGFLVEPFDTDRLAEGIAWCLANMANLSRESCSQSVRYGFNLHTQAQRYISLYNALLGSS